MENFENLPFIPACYFEGCDDEPNWHVTFKSRGNPEAFLCDTHHNRACEFDQLIEVRLAITGIERILKNYDKSWGYD